MRRLGGVAFAAGVIAGLTMTTIFLIARAFGWTSLDLEMGWGSLFIGTVSPATWLFGMLLHLVLSGVIGMIYGKVFRAIRRSGWDAGATLGIFHWLIGGMFLGFFPGVHSLMPEQIPAPGFFALNLGGLSFLGFFMTHLIYGSVVGAIYPVTSDRTSARMHEEEVLRDVA